MSVWQKAVKGLSVLVLMGGTQLAQAQDYWKFFDGKVAPSEGQRKIVPEKYEIYELDQNSMYRLLEHLPNDPSMGRLVHLPVPGKGMRAFRIWESSIMEAPLQRLYPQIRTFTATDVADPSISAKVDMTDFGFHAMVYDAERTYFIDPYSDKADGYYIAYYKNDYTKPLSQWMSCEVDDSYRSGNDDGGPVLERQNGTEKKTFRLALACTGEYAEAVAGPNPTVSGVASAMVTTMNRVNGVYEREFSVTMVLIANNNLLIYTDPQTDPFTANNDGYTLMGQNRSNTNNVIGSANYDIGHIFSTGGGGIAALGSVCTSSKAMGVTGSSNPVGDPFDIDYVCHEMGHQFGADHTFNRCSGTENQSTAYEPGGGTTIMAYAGICGLTNNVQAHSDAYFHAVSMNEIQRFLANNANCAQVQPGRAAPSLPSITATYTIPFATPFELTAPTVAGGGTQAILYNWEQWDLGDYRQDENGGGNFLYGPSMRSYFFDTSATRSFPRIDSLVSGQYSYKGLRLANLTRSLNFKASVRSIENGWGTFDVSEEKVLVKVERTNDPFRIKKPVLRSDTLWNDKPNTIEWEVAQTDIAPISTPTVNIYLSVDGGYTYPRVLATNVPNTGTAQVNIPGGIRSDRARIKIKGNGNIFFDISIRDLFVRGEGTSIADILAHEGLKVYPNPAKDVVFLKYEGNGALSVSLVNALGRQVWSDKVRGNATIDVQGLAKGIYYLRVLDESRGLAHIEKVVLQ